jgi:hypothetical protein
MFNGVRIGVGFQPEPQFTFRCTIINVKPGFMAVSLSAAPYRKLVAKSKFCYSTHALCNRSANLFAPKCPIESTTHKFPRLVVRAS